MSITSPASSRFDQQHAIVIGGSMAGLLTARVLSEHFKQVTIIERDHLTDGAESRKGVPQGRHGHVLLASGAVVLAKIFPDLFPKLAQDGAAVHSSSDARWYQFGVWKAPFPVERQAVYPSRPFLEQHVRACLIARENVRFIDACEVTQLCVKENQITGVVLRSRTAEQHEENLAANVVIDASGRGSRTPQWLASLGYGQVEESSIRSDVGYVTRIYRRPDQPPFSWRLLIVYSTPPDEKRAGYVLPIEDDQWMVTLAGMLRNYPPDDEEGFLEFARSLPTSDLYEAIKDAEPMTPIVTYKYTANRWRHYERMMRLPEGFIVMGDALCSFNPVYGQGMSVAALEATLLDTFLRKQQPDNIAGWTQRFQKSLVKVVKNPWKLATSDDFRFPENEGKRPFGTDLFNWYMRRIHELMASNPLVTLRGYQVLLLLKPLSVLFDPRIIWAVLGKELASRQQKPGAARSTHEASSSTPTPTEDIIAR